MNVVVVPIGNNVVIKTFATGTPYVVSGQAGTALAMQYLAGSLVAGVVLLGGVVVAMEFMRSEYDPNSIINIWKTSGEEVKGAPKLEQKSILQIWREEGEKAKVN